MRDYLYSKYHELVCNIEGIPEYRTELYARELVRRHKKGWSIPITVYREKQEVFYYKENLERNSPYYSDLLKIEDRNELKEILQSIYFRIKIKERNEYEYTKLGRKRS